jgi:multiple sugar transport system substrate-binding protein
MNPALADPSYDADDLIDGYVYNIGVAGGNKGLSARPRPVRCSAFPSVRKPRSLATAPTSFEKHGLEVPETYDELLELACLIPELEPGMGGLASRAASGHQASHAFLLHLARWAAGIFDDNWNPIVNNAAGVEAAKALKTIVDCGTEGRRQLRLPKRWAFANGDICDVPRHHRVAGQIDDPSRQRSPARSTGQCTRWVCAAASQTGGFGIAIPRNARTRKLRSC